MTREKKYTVEGKMFAYTVDTTSWYFVYLSEELSLEIKETTTRRVGFQFVPVEVTVGETIWRTTLFPTKQGPYMIAIKKQVRLKEDIREGELVKITFRLV